MRCYAALLGLGVMLLTPGCTVPVTPPTPSGTISLRVESSVRAPLLFTARYAAEDFSRNGCGVDVGSGPESWRSRTYRDTLVGKVQGEAALVKVPLRLAASPCRWALESLSVRPRAQGRDLLVAVNSRLRHFESTASKHQSVLVLECKTSIRQPFCYQPMTVSKHFVPPVEVQGDGQMLRLDVSES